MSPLSERRLAPRERVLARLAHLPPGVRGILPTKWERIGRVLLLKVPEGLAPYEQEVAAAFAEALNVETVLADEGGVAGEFREMVRTRFLLGSDAVTTHVEHGIRYMFDASRIMFSSGNVEERARMGRVKAQGQTVVDLFAGIGYFAIPLAVHAGASRVVACEKNPLAHRYLVENVARNGVAGVVSSILGDCRTTAPRGIADRVVMGYFPGTAAFLPTALSALKSEGGTIHYHATAPKETARSELETAVAEVCAGAGRGVAFERFRVVKNYAPGIVHAVLDARVGAA